MYQWRSHAPRTKFHFLEKSGHFPFIEEPAETTALIRSFLADNGR
jgi:pimeloyl-ACP methyl ester carboxylesterase